MEKLYVTKGYTGACTVRGKKARSNEKYIEFENIPLAGFKLGKNNGEMIDPRGFIVKVGSSTMDRLLRTCTIYNGTILNKLEYRRFGSYYSPTHPDFKEEVVKKVLVKNIPLYSIFRRNARGNDLINLGKSGRLSINKSGEFFIGNSYKHYVMNAYSSYCYPHTMNENTTVREPSKIETSLSSNITYTLSSYLGNGYVDSMYPSAFNTKKLKLMQSSTVNYYMFEVNGYKFFRVYSSNGVKKLPLLYIDENFNISETKTDLKRNDLFLVFDSSNELIGKVNLPDVFTISTMTQGKITSYELVGYLLNERFVFSNVSAHYA